MNSEVLILPATFPTFPAKDNLCKIWSWYGNPDLKSFQTLMQSVNVGFNKKIVTIDLLAGYNYEFNPVMESVFYESGVASGLLRIQLVLRILKTLKRILG